MSWMNTHQFGWLLGLAAATLLASTAMGAQSEAANTVKTWESADERLTQLLDQVPEQARPGIERALQANREGRQNAQEALNRGDERRAERALEKAAAKAETGLEQARKHVPASVLPRLDEAAARMSVGGRASAAGAGNGAAGDSQSTSRPTFDRPGSTMPGGMSNPSSTHRPATPPPPRGPN